LPISALLACVRKLIPRRNDGQHQQIVRRFGSRALRPPIAPMSDAELARAIAEFLQDAQSARRARDPSRRMSEVTPDPE